MNAGVRGLLAALSAVLLVSCGGGGGGGGSGQTQPPVSGVGTVSGSVISADTGTGIANANIEAGNASTSTDASGNFTLTNVPASDRQAIRVTATGFAESIKVTDVVQGGTRSVRVRLLPVGVTQSVDPTLAATVAVPNSTARVVVPANSLVKSSGGAVSGNVNVQVTPINPALASEVMPGDYSTVNAGNPATIESFGALVVSMRDAQGDRVNLRGGNTSVIRIPVGTRSSNTPATIPLFHMDEATGRWIQEGTATLSANGLFYEGTVAHFSTWNADRVIDTILVSGCVKDGVGQSVGAGVQVVSDGIDYSGSATDFTDASGCYSVAMKSNGRATVTAISGTKISNTLSVGPQLQNFNAGENLVLSEVNGALAVKLTWGSSPSDLDSHILLPNGLEVYYSNEGSLTAQPFTKLDVDDTTGFGPEVMTLRRTMIGTYRYFVHNFSGSFAPGMTGSPARVEVTLNGTTSVFQPPAGEGGNRYWHVFDLTVNANCVVTITPRQLWLPVSPTVVGGAATFCN